MNGLIGIYGASGHGRETLPIARSQFLEPGTRIVFIDDGLSKNSVNGHEIVSWQSFLSWPVEIKHVSLAIANSFTRQKLADKCRLHGIKFTQIQASNVVIFDDVTIGEGAILSPFVTLTSNIQIGQHFHANIYASVAHDCVIGDYVTFGPAVKCNGNVHIADHVYIGTGAVIKQGQPGKPLTIGRGAIIGMGAVVTRDVPAGVTVVGNPARPLVKD